MAGLMDFITNNFGGEAGSARLAGLGSILMAADRGRQADVSPYLGQINTANQRQQLGQSLQTDYADKFSDEERKFLLTLDPQTASSLVADRLFAKPEAVKGVEVGGRLVDPTTGRIIYDGGPDQKKLTEGAPSGFMWSDPADRTKGVVPISGYTKDPPAPDEYARYVAEEVAAGRAPLSRIDYAKAKSPSMSLETDSEGRVRLIQGGSPGETKPFTEGQAKDNVYVTRAEGALDALEPVADTLVNRAERAADVVPLGMARGFQSDEFQVAKNAGDEFLQAILRKDTGAAITSDEQALYGATYLPQPGDNAALLAQKRQARLRALEAIKSGMSPAQIVAKEKALQASAPPQSPSETPKRRVWSPDGGLK